MPEFKPVSKDATRLKQLFEDAERALLRECNCILLKSTIVGQDDPAVKRIEQIKSELLAGCIQWVEEAITASYLKGLQVAQEEATMESLGELHIKAMEALAQNTYSRLAGVVDVVGRQIEDMIKSHDLAIIKQSIQIARGKDGR